MQRRHHHVGPEARAALAKSPAFLLPSAFYGSECQLLIRLAPFYFFREIEPRKVLSNDLLGSVALDLLRAFVPAQNDSRGIKHENRIVFDFFHQRPQTLLALPQGLFRSLALSHIADRRGY